uniref:Uncharacterized protein n=1 Tax=Ceratitis capitata TaxID=7213 RepID=W8BR01_CERCA
MLEKNAKISVLRTMIGLGEEIEPHFIVPQNSISNIRQKIGLGERPQTGTQMPTLIPLENSLRSTQPATTKCPHCESMAKNFLYLESLIRNNYNPKAQCGLCYSSLKYLQYVNKSILQVFGNFESIVNAASTFTNNRTRTPFAAQPSLREARAITAKPAAAKTISPKKNLAKKNNIKEGGKVTRPVLKTTTRAVSSVRLTGGGRHACKARNAKHPSAKSKNKSKSKTNHARLTGGFDSAKRKKSAPTKPNSVKLKNVKSKRSKIRPVRARK